MAEYSVWNPGYSVCSAALDAQHRQIIDIINEVYRAIQGEKPQDDLKMQFFRLRIFTETHFRYEETLLKIIRYPEYERHKSYHDEMVTRTKEIIRKSLAGEAEAKCLLDYLRMWWINHILNVDMPYAESIRELRL